MTDASLPPTITIDALGLDQGAHLLIRRALAALPPGQALRVEGTAPELALHLAAWCRQQGHALAFEEAVAPRVRARITSGGHHAGRWRGALGTGHSDPAQDGAVAEQAAPQWGLAARGAQVEAGAPAFQFALDRKQALWADSAAELYAQACAAQWQADTAIDWAAPFELPDAVEDAVVQLMTYLVENENAALLVPARHLGQLHPHYREVAQLLALQCADEARHIDVFTRRIALRGRTPALSTAGGQASLKTLFEAPDFSTAAFLLSVLGEGTFVNLLNFLYEHAPDPVTRQIARLAARDEARHVAFGMAHLEYRLAREPDYHATLRNAVEQRYDELASTAGLNEEVFDALILLAAGGLDTASVARGFALVQGLKQEMATGRRARLARLGFARQEAQRLADMHTRNFM